MDIFGPVETSSVLNVKHEPLYATWSSMNHRCHSPWSYGFDNYGARGVQVCARWRACFYCWKDDMGPKPSPSHSIDRIDSAGNYEPTNCRWATPEEQRANRRPRRPKADFRKALEILKREERSTPWDASREIGYHCSPASLRAFFRSREKKVGDIKQISQQEWAWVGEAMP